MKANTIRQMFRRDVVLLALFASLLLFATAASAMVISFDYEPLGTQYGTPVGNIPGDYIFSEDSADLFVVEYFSGGAYFNYLQIDPAFTFFGQNQIMELNNASLMFNFTAQGDASFDFVYFGGDVNLEVNGGASVVSEPLAYPANPAPGVNLVITGLTYFGGGYKGTVELTGPVVQLRIGGQEYFIDNVTCANGIGISPNTNGNCDYLVSHDTLAYGTVYDSSGYAPGDWIFNEDGIDVYVDIFNWGSGSGFNYCMVDVSAAPGFGVNQTMLINNVTNRYDIAGLGIHTSEVTFEFLDFGGMENLQVNGATLYIGDFTTFPSTVAPGVTMNLATYAVGGGYRAEVTLSGDVNELLVGGQEFMIDEICVIEGEDPPPSECDYLVDYESQIIGTEFSTATGYIAGDVILVEDNIPVMVDNIVWPTGGLFFGYATIVPAFSATGDANAMNLNNIANVFDIAALGITVEKVTFEFVTYGGDENLQVNGAPIFVGQLESAPMAIAPGVNYFVTTSVVPGGLYGEAVLYGNVQKLLLAGQEFEIDNICVYEDTSTSGCDNLSDNESLALGTTWGSSYGNVPGDLIFNEDGIDVALDIFDTGSGLVFNNASIASAFAPIGTDNVIAPSNINLVYDFAGLGTVDSVTIDFFDGAGVENLEINGETLHIGEFEAMPNNIASGVTLYVDYTDYSTYQVGKITLVGDVQKMKIGGQQFYIDNVCAHLGGISNVTPGNYVKRRLELKDNFPNPFNPSTTLRFSLSDEDYVRLTIHDISGRIVRTLIDNTRTAGTHQVVWDGRDSRNAAVATGLYFVRVETSSDVQTQKIALIK